MTRQLRTLTFATPDNVKELAFYLQFTPVLYRLDKARWLKESRHLNAALVALVKGWHHSGNNGDKRLGPVVCAEQLNGWLSESVDREGHKLINKAFAKWRYNQRAKVHKIDVKGDTFEQLAVLKSLWGLDSYDEVVNRLLPDKRELLAMSVERDKILSDNDGKSG